MMDTNDEDCNLDIEEKSKIDAIFKQILINRKKDKVRAETVLNGKILGLYFSASWSPPCRQFTPKLAEFHKELIGKRKLPLEIVYVPCDRSEDEMMSYMAELHGDWWALPMEKDLIMEVRSLYDIDIVPKLLIVKANGDVISRKGRKEVTDRGVAAFRSWFDAAEMKLVSTSKSNIFESSIFDESEKTETKGDDTKDIAKPTINVDQELNED